MEIAPGKYLIRVLSFGADGTGVVCLTTGERDDTWLSLRELTMESLALQSLRLLASPRLLF
jgi:hypothetical protein